MDFLCSATGHEAACLTVVKLEKALDVMGDTEGPAVECLKVGVGAWNAVKRPPNGEVEECRNFINLSEKRISEMERGSEVLALDEAKARLLRLEAVQAEVQKLVSEPLPPVEWAGEVQRLREELSRVRAGRSPALVVHSFQSSAEAANRVVVRKTCGVS